jgi:aminoglycoside 2'-N-acetyltransferase I
MTGFRTAHTADLNAETRLALRRLLDAAFGPVSDDTYENTLGGSHAMIFDDGDLIGHASVVPRRVLHRGKALRAGYIEGVAVREDQRRRGHGATLMTEAERLVRAAFDLGALGASEVGSRMYAARGWHRWQGPLSALTPDGIRPTPEVAGYIYVLPASVPLDLAGELTCDWRDGALW